MKKLIIGAIIAMAFHSQASADVIKVEGGGTTIAAVFSPYKDLFEEDTGHTLSVVQSSAVKGLIALNDGKVDIAAGAHPLEDLIAGAAKDGRVIDKTDLVATPIEDNVLIAIVNKTNPVRSLSHEQLKAIFTGKIVNWKKVGGKNFPIVVVWGTETEGQNMQFTRIALQGEPVISKMLEVKNYRDISEAVRSNPACIGIIPFSMHSPITHSLKTPKITSPMFLITKGAPSKNVQLFADFYKKETNLLP